MIVLDRPRITAINSNAASERIVSGSLESDSPFWTPDRAYHRDGSYCPRKLERLNSTEGGFVMGKQIQWETSLTTVKAKAKKGKKLILMDFYNNL